MFWKFGCPFRVKLVVVWILIFLIKFNLCGTWTHPDYQNLEEGAKCSLVNGEPGVCKLLPNCTVYYEGRKKNTMTYGELKRCSFVGYEEVICCPTDDFNFKRTKGDNFPITEPTTPPIERPSQAACRNYMKSNPSALSYHIIGGTSVNLGEFPHMGAILKSIDPVPVLLCGSSLISEQYVLTAAHCFTNKLEQPQVVRFGSVLLNSTDEQPVDAVIDNIYIHPQYRIGVKYHDIAILKLKTPIRFSPFIRPACLHNNVAEIDSLIQLFVTGWGVTNIATQTRSDALLKTNVTWVSTRKCAGIYKKEFLKQEIIYGQACAHDPELKNDACTSDSGGPLQMIVHNIATIVGIVSFGKFCATSTPAVYTRVAAYLNWIECVVWPTEEQKQIGNCSNVF